MTDSLAKPACICVRWRDEDRKPLVTVDPDCPAHRVGEGKPVGLFPRIVTHEQAREAAKNLIDAFFNNRDGKGVCISIPARADNDDIVLSDYIRQQAAKDDLPAARARCEAAGWKVMERRTRKAWTLLLAVYLRPEAVEIILAAVGALGLILPDDGETK